MIKKFCLAILGVVVATNLCAGCSSSSKSSTTTKSTQASVQQQSKTAGNNSDIKTSMFTSKSDLVKEAKRIAKTDQSLGSIMSGGKVVIWDNVSDDTFESSEIKDSLLWGRGDDKGYVAIIDYYNNIRVSTYTLRGKSEGTRIPGYRRDAVVYVYNLRTHRCLGRTTIRGFNPPENYRSKGAPKAIYGNTKTPIANWVNRTFRG